MHISARKSASRRTETNWSVLLGTAGPLFVSLTCLTGAAADAARSTDEIARLVERAAPGTTVLVPPGLYVGPLRVNKPITLDGADRVTIDGRGEGTVVELRAANITFRRFRIVGSGMGVDREPAGIRAEAGPVVIENNQLEDVLFGIDLRTAPDSIVRGNGIVGKDLDVGRRGDGIRLWWSHGCTIEGNTVRQSRDMVFWYSENLVVRDNQVRDSRYGLHFMYSHQTRLHRNTLERNSVGVYLMYSNGITLEENLLTGNRGPSGYGLGLKDCDDIVAHRNRLLANRVGAYIDNTPSSVDADGRVTDNLIAFNEMGMLITPNTRRNVMAGNGFVENEEQVAVHGRGDLVGNTFARDGRGNFWSDYAGFDRNDDGVGDLPYESRSLFENLLAREPNLRLFLHSPAQQAIEFTARALPEMRPAPKFVDPAPLMSAVRLDAGERAPQAAPAMVATCVLLLGLGGGTVIGALYPATPRWKETSS